MTEIYNVHSPPETSDYEFIMQNGAAYTREVSGFDDWLRKGHPEPENPDTVLAELYSPDVPAVLWATGGWSPVAFLVTRECLATMQESHVSGFSACPVEIVKVATKGKRKRSKREFSGEPEDLIDRRRNVKDLVQLPELWGVKITGTCRVRPVQMPAFEGRSIRPYTFAERPKTDLFHPVFQGSRYGGHLFCKARFKLMVEKHTIENIDFTPFEIWIDSIGGEEW